MPSIERAVSNTILEVAKVVVVFEVSQGEMRKKKEKKSRTKEGFTTSYGLARRKA
jgi:hypothetical protein